MTTKANDTINKAYRNIPKDVCLGFNFDILPFRGIRYYWLIFYRKFLYSRKWTRGASAPNRVLK